MLEAEETGTVLDETSSTRALPFVIVGIPAFNEEAMIAQMVLGAQKYAGVVVVCDDGSNDMTGEIAKRLGADVVSHERNMGYGASIKSLFKRAHELDADVLVTMDADGQHNPEEIPFLVKPIVQGVADIVVGSRFIETHGTEEMPFYRKVGAQLITKLVNGSSKNGTSDAQSGFRAYNRQAIERLIPFENGMGASVEILLKASKNDLRTCEVPSSCKYNNGNVATSKQHPITHGIGVVLSIVRFIIGERLLTLLGMSGLLCLLVALGFGVWALQIYAIEHYIMTNIALASVVSFFIGFFLLLAATLLYVIARITTRVGRNITSEIKKSQSCKKPNRIKKRNKNL